MFYNNFIFEVIQLILEKRTEKSLKFSKISCEYKIICKYTLKFKFKLTKCEAHHSIWTFPTKINFPIILLLDAVVKNLINLDFLKRCT